MKKSKYQSPQMEVASVENMQIICVSENGIYPELDNDDTLYEF